MVTRRSKYTFEKGIVKFTELININESKCLMKEKNPREYYARLNTGVVNTFLWSNCQQIVINLN